MAIIAGNETTSQCNLNLWGELLIENGMAMSESKTKVIVIPNEEQKLDIQIEGDHLKQVGKF